MAATWHSVHCVSWMIQQTGWLVLGMFNCQPEINQRELSRMKLFDRQVLNNNMVQYMLRQHCGVTEPTCAERGWRKWTRNKSVWGVGGKAGVEVPNTQNRLFVCHHQFVQHTIGLCNDWVVLASSMQDWVVLQKQQQGAHKGAAIPCMFYTCCSRLETDDALLLAWGSRCNTYLANIFRVYNIDTFALLRQAKPSTSSGSPQCEWPNTFEAAEAVIRVSPVNSSQPASAGYVSVDSLLLYPTCDSSSCHAEGYIT